MKCIHNYWSVQHARVVNSKFVISVSSFQLGGGEKGACPTLLSFFGIQGPEW